MGIIEEAATELAKSSPFALMCIVFLFILSKAHNKSFKQLKEIHESSISTIKEAYEKVYESFSKRIMEKQKK